MDNELKAKLIRKFQDNGYYNIMKGFLCSRDFDVIFDYLVEQVEDGKRFTPPLKYLFGAFDACPYDKLKVIFVGGEPFSDINVSNGLLFDCSNDDYLANQTKFLFEAVTRTHKIDKRKKEEVGKPNILSWANQGCLMLNTPLTTIINKPGLQHKSIWLPFLSYLFDMLNSKKYIWVFVGKNGMFYNDLINNYYHKFYITNPYTAIYNNDYWECYDLFNKINYYLKQNQQTTIKWIQ